MGINTHQFPGYNVLGTVRCRDSPGEDVGPAGHEEAAVEPDCASVPRGLEQIPEDIRNVDTEESRQVSEGRSLGLLMLWRPEKVLLELSGEKEGGLEMKAPQQGVRGQWHGRAQGIWGRWASGDVSGMGYGGTDSSVGIKDHGEMRS